jgi:hypothetical protein
LFTELKRGWSRGVSGFRHCVPNYLWSFPHPIRGVRWPSTRPFPGEDKLESDERDV